MDFAALPPEINSARMYSGSGSAPTLAAAAAWGRLADELSSAAAGYGSQVASLTDGPWQGPASLSMAAAAAAQVQWLSISAARAEETASQAKAAASAYEAAFAMTVPPAVISANRAQLMSLIATNFLGQNAAAIAATEAHYAQMWAQDAAAMYAYAGASASASRLTPFNPPARVINADGLLNQAAEVAHATSAAMNTPTVLSELTAAIPAALQNLASPLQSTTAAAAPASGLAGILSDLGLTSPISFLVPANTGLTATAVSGAYSALGSAAHADANILSTQQQISDTETRILQRIDQTSLLNATGSAKPAVVSADSGRAALIGRLSVPQGWSAQAPAARLAALTTPTAGLSAAADELASGPASLLSGMGLATTALAGHSVGTTASLRRWERLMVTTRSDTGLPQTAPGNPLNGIAAELRELAALRDSHILTDDEFDRQKRRLLDN
jgi:PPE-repeat protein